jgi:hypothetical protein
MGDTNGAGVLLWPKADRSDKQLWALTVTVEAVDIAPWTLGITVEWQREANLLSISQIVSTDAVTV